MSERYVPSTFSVKNKVSRTSTQIQELESVQEAIDILENKNNDDNIHLCKFCSLLKTHH